MTGLLIAGLGLQIGGGLWGAYSQKQAANETARAQIWQGYMQKQAYEAEAAQMARQAKMENVRAGIAQIQGEQEAEKRSRQLAQEIGSIYSDFAGNGVLVDTAIKNDTVGSVLRTQMVEGQADINTIRDNTKMNVWEHQQAAKSYAASAAMKMMAGENALISGYYSADQTRKSARSSFISSLIGLGGQTMTGIASGVNTYDQYGWGWTKNTKST